MIAASLILWLLGAILKRWANGLFDVHVAIIGYEQRALYYWLMILSFLCYLASAVIGAILAWRYLP